MALCAQATRRVLIGPAVVVNVGLEPALVREAVAQVHPGARRAGRDPASIDLWTLEGKHVPGDLADAVRRVQQGYQPAAHEALGPSPNARVLDAEPALRAWLAERFAVVGPAAACAGKLRGVVEAGINGLLVTGFVADRARLIRALGEDVLPRL